MRDYQVPFSIIFSRLVLWEGSKSSLPGVWDPCPGEPDKWLLVQYTYKVYIIYDI